jgi:hypothetical protein
MLLLQPVFLPYCLSSVTMKIFQIQIADLIPMFYDTGRLCITSHRMRKSIKLVHIIHAKQGLYLSVRIKIEALENFSVHAEY